MAEDLPDDISAAWTAVTRKTGYKAALNRVDRLLEDGEEVLALGGC